MIHPLSKAVTLTLHTSCSVLFNRGDAIVWQITVICCSIQAGAWSSLVGCPWGYEGIFALIGNVLRRGDQRLELTLQGVEECSGTLWQGRKRQER
jgi:hypothetical protein